VRRSGRTSWVEVRAELGVGPSEERRRGGELGRAHWA